jgi:hypothetical protein
VRDDGKWLTAMPMTVEGTSVLQQTRAFTIYDEYLKPDMGEVRHTHTWSTIAVLVDGTFENGGIGGEEPVRCGSPAGGSRFPAPRLIRSRRSEATRISSRSKHGEAQKWQSPTYLVCMSHAAEDPVSGKQDPGCAPGDEFQRFEPHLQQSPLIFKRSLYTAGQRIKQVCFPDKRCLFGAVR